MARRHHRSAKHRFAYRLIFALKRRLDVVAEFCAALLRWADRRSLWKLHRRLYGIRRTYWYFRGVADELGSAKAWATYSADSCLVRGDPITIDLSDGFEAAEQVLKECRVVPVRLVYGDIEIGFLPAQQAAEPCSSRHLRAAVAGPFAASYLKALAQSGDLSIAPQGVQPLLVARFEELKDYFGPAVPGRMWREPGEVWSNLRPTIE